MKRIRRKIKRKRTLSIIFLILFYIGLVTTSNNGIEKFLICCLLALLSGALVVSIQSDKNKLYQKQRRRARCCSKRLSMNGFTNGL